MMRQFLKRGSLAPVVALVSVMTMGWTTGSAQTPAAVGDTTPAYRVDAVASGLAFPWALGFLSDGRALVTERPGRLRVLQAQPGGGYTLQPEPVTGVPPVFAQGQAGLFDLLVDPDFARNQRIFISYAHGTAGANHLRVASARLDGQRLQDVQVLLTTQPAKTHAQHFGGRMALLPDGTLVVAMGDGNLERTDAQRLNTHLGKLLRIRTDGSTPADNPFLNEPGALAQIYSRGHRNPQGLVWVSGPGPWGEGGLYAHEHGARGGDELNRIEPGLNYGWPLATDGVDYTGARITPFTALPGLTPPLLHWTPSIAPAGLAWYDGALFPAWRGSLFVAALKERSVRRVALKDGQPQAQQTLFTELGERLRDVRAGPDGALYLLTDNAEGRVLRVAPR